MLRRWFALCALACLAVWACGCAGEKNVHTPGPGALQAREVLERQSRAAPHSRRAMDLYADGRFSDPRAAAEHLNRAVAEDPGDAKLYLQRAVAREQGGDVRGALADLDTALESDPSMAQAAFLKGMLLQGLGKHQEAIAAFHKALDLEPEFITAWDGIGTSYGAMGRYDRADAAYTQALGMSPASKTIYLHRALARSLGGDAASAEADLTVAIGLDPRDGVVFRERARVRLARGDHAGAVADLEQARELLPMDTGVRLLLAGVLAATPEPGLADPAWAEALAREVMDMEGGPRPESLDMLARAYARQGRFQAAAEAQKRAVEALGDGDARAAGYRERLDLYRAGRPFLVLPGE